MQDIWFDHADVQTLCNSAFEILSGIFEAETV